MMRVEGKTIIPILCLFADIVILSHMNRKEQTTQCVFLNNISFQHAIVASIALFTLSIIRVAIDFFDFIINRSKVLNESILLSGTIATSLIANVVISQVAMANSNCDVAWGMWNIQFIHFFMFVAWELNKHAPFHYSSKVTSYFAIIALTYQLCRYFSYESLGLGNSSGLTSVVLFCVIVTMVLCISVAYLKSLPYYLTSSMRVDMYSFCFYSMLLLALIVCYSGMAIPNTKLENFSATFATFVTYALTICNIGVMLFHSQQIRLQVMHTQSLLELKRIFVRYVSHEIRTPLNTVFIGLNLLREDILSRNHNTDMVETVDDIKESCDIAVNILNDLLMYEKLEGGLLSLDLQNVAIWDMVSDVTKRFNIQARQNNVSLKVIHTDPLLSRVRVNIDKHKIAQVIRNLVSNALKFTPTNGVVTVRASIKKDMSPMSSTTTTRKQGVSAPVAGFILIEVEDSGSGIAIENQQKLFKEIIQFHPEKLQNGQGSGLGLWISSKIIELHNGTIGVFSKGESFGTTFHIMLPIAYFEGKERIGSFFGSLGSLALSRTIAAVRHDIETGTTFSTKPDDLTSVTNFELAAPMEASEVSNDYNQFIEFESKVRSPKTTGDSTPKKSSSSKIAPTDNRYCKKELSVITASSTRANDVCDRNSRMLSLEDHGYDNCYIDSSCLIVDDSITNRKLLLRLLKNRFSTLDDAADGEEALNKVEEQIEKQTATGNVHLYDLIIIDHHMPKMDGSTAVRAMRALGYRGIIIGLTGNALSVDIEEFEAAGADKVLVKPLDVNAFKKVYQEIKTQRSQTNT